MAEDIVERLRYEAWHNPPEGDTADAHWLAADALAEIERLRALWAAARSEIERLRAALQLVVDQLEEGFPKSAQQFAMDALGEHLKEARRER